MAAPRMTLGNLALKVGLSVQYNPEKISEEVAVKWQELTIQGESHEPMQYVATGNMKLTFELGFDARSSSQPKFDTKAALNFVRALAYTSRAANTINEAAPPRVLVVVPGLYRIKCNLESYKVEYRLFDYGGSSLAPTWFVAQLAFKEARVSRLYGEDVLQSGAIRGD